jgi:hypothetical protein
MPTGSIGPVNTAPPPPPPPKAPPTPAQEALAANKAKEAAPMPAQQNRPNAASEINVTA